MALRRHDRAWGRNNGPTAVVEHGANPGLVSHFTKQALDEIAERRDPRTARRRQSAAARGGAGRRRDYGELAHAPGVKVIHISERDTQITDRSRRRSTSSSTPGRVEGFYEEGIAPAEMGWGTHEKRAAAAGARARRRRPGNQICLAQMGMQDVGALVGAGGEITGMVIRHGEAFTICDHLTVVAEDGLPVYRPTVHYAYCPADAAIAVDARAARCASSSCSPPSAS